jgi:signal transduction histidine kinase
VPAGRVVYLRDVTHETEVARMKTEFLTTAAHELRTPLASVHGFTELLLAEEFPRDVSREMLTTMHRQSSLLVKLVNELLDLARIEARSGKDLQVELLPLVPLLSEVVEGFYLESAPCQVLLDLPADAVWVTADRVKLTQAVNNVLSNACKYSPQSGTIQVQLRRREGHQGGEVGVSITDQGIGMTDSQLARIYERFFRADPGGAIGGTGLGMTLVKEFLELMGGSVEVTSALGAGTVVTLWLPAAAPPDHAQA